MPTLDFNCGHCQFFKPLSVNGSVKWLCQKHEKQIDDRDPGWCVCRVWRPAPDRFPPELQRYFSTVAPGALNHLKSKELYRTLPELQLMDLS